MLDGRLVIRESTAAVDPIVESRGHNGKGRPAAASGGR
jgi:hypothetical protein